MKPAPFRYCAPETVDEALELLATGDPEDEVKLLAGGQSLVPAMNFRLARPGLLIDLNRIAELASIATRDDAEGSILRLGAMVRQSAAEHSPDVARLAPLMGEALPSVAHTQIRNRGTVGGSLAHADPAAELPAVMLALDARMHLRSVRGERAVDAGDFFLGLFETALEPDEMLTAIEIDAASAVEGSCFEEVSRRRGDYALAGAAARVRLDADGTCRFARLTFLSVADLPVRALEAEQMLLGERPHDELLRAVAEHAARREIDPGSDIHASSAFRRHLAAGLARRTLATAVSRATAAHGATDHGGASS
ncbi:MAG: xanthine dehydrogenase family protein subunit M [Acidobacteria bacterium]|nr:MAG: xanthine dehydrogenase family protein subunit M [Acidobacteriota bacterium]REK09743.1 MAG: xanthine dehydrogenase family protein subunit M [Acidobacteriota bacterium]